MNSTPKSPDQSGIPEISVIVPVFQHWELIPGLLDAMRDQSIPSARWELIVVDNGSDELPAQDALPPFARLLICRTPGSYAARNAALKEARGELLVFTDADCRPEPEWLEGHLRAREASGREQLQGGAVRLVIDGPGERNPYQLYDMALGMPQKRYVEKRGYAITANLAVPRQVALSLGGFDMSRFSGGDAAFCQRARATGVPLVYVADAIVRHPARESWEELSTKVRRVKGGQIRSGSPGRRALYFLRALLPPVPELIRLVQSKGFNAGEKAIVCRVQLALWWVGLTEVLSLVFGKKPERR